MAILASIATGDFTSSSTWAVCDPTAALDPITGLANTTLTTSYVASSAFTPGAITVAGIIVKVNNRIGTTGTMSVELYNSTAGASVAGTEVTINTADIPAGSAFNGAIYLKFAAPVTLLAATNYQVRAKTSSSSQISLNRNGTANNWCRQLVTTTTAAPGASDRLYVVTEHTGTGAFTTRTVTMNETATTAYGSIEVGSQSSLLYAYSASTNYYLKCQHVVIGASATFTIGDSTNPIPSTSTAVLEINCGSAGQYGVSLAQNSIFKTHGATKTNYYSLLTANKNAGATTISVTSTSGWAANDVLVFSPTRSTVTEYETKTVSTIDSATDLTLTAGLTSYKSGTSPTQSEVGNITRNVMIRGMTETNGTWIRTGNNGMTIDCRYTHFRYFAGTGTAVAGSVQGNFDLEGNNLTSCLIEYCSFTDMAQSNSYSAIYIGGINCAAIIRYNVFYKVGIGINCAAAVNATNDALTIQENIIIWVSSGSTSGIAFGSTAGGAAVIGNRVSGCSLYGIGYTSSTTSLYKLENNVCHSNTNNGMRITGIISATSINGNTCYRNNQDNFFINMNTAPAGAQNIITINNLTCFGGSGTNACLSLNGAYSNGINFTNCNFNAGSTADGASNARDCISMASTFCGDVVQFIDCNIGQSEIITNLFIQTSTPRAGVVLINCAIDATNTFQGTTQTTLNGTVNSSNFDGLISLNHDQVKGSNRRWMTFGTLSTDTTIFNDTSPSVRMTPINASQKMQGPFKIVPVTDGTTVTVSAYVRKSTAGDGTAYNGNQPRLMVRANSAVGIDSDTVLDTMTAAAGTWEELTGTTITVDSDGVLEFFIDCDGTTGWVNVDDFTTTSTVDSDGTGYWDIYGNSFMINQNSGGGGSGGSFPFC